LFTGIGGFDHGFDRAGMECAWQVEIDKHCNAVLEARWPGVRRFGDVSEVGSDSLEDVELICGGFPCQDLSVAGKRAGLGGARSGLFFEAARIVGELRPKWVVIENVPGLLSSNKGEDFCIVLETLTELGYGVAWRVLDSQYFGVAQRRRRVFIVGCLGDGASAAEVLFEPKGMCRDTPPSREEGERTAACPAQCTEPSGKCRVASAITTEEGLRGPRGDGSDNLVPDVVGALCANAATKKKHGDGGISSIQQYLSGHIIPELANPPKHIVTSVAQNQRGEVRTSDIHPQLTCGGGKPGEGYPCVAIQDVTGRDKKQNGKGFNEDDIAYTVDAAATQGVAESKQVQWASGGGQLENDTAQALRAGAEHNYQFLRTQMTVRRLTPTECERLQGFPDSWTAEGVNGPISDSARYRMLGNAVTVNVAEWIGRRLNL